LVEVKKKRENLERERERAGGYSVIFFSSVSNVEEQRATISLL
jgi:hypothetical protein